MVVPLLLIVLVNFVLVMVEFYFLAPLGEGAISGLRYGRRLLAIFTGLGYSIQTVYFAREAREGEVNGDPTQQISLLAATIRDSTSILAPASALLGLVATPLVTILFQRGSFGVESTVLTSTALRFLAFGLLGHILYGIYIRAGILLRRSGLSLVCAAVVVVTALTFNLLAVPHMGFGAVALGYSLSMLTAALFGHLAISYVLRGQKEILRGGLSALADFTVAVVCAVPVWLMANHLFPALPSGLVDAIIRLAAISLAYMAVFTVSCIVLRRTNVFGLARRLLQRRREH